MWKRLLLILVVASVIACSSQDSTDKYLWKDFSFEDAGIKISLPCEPLKEVKVFKKEPKLAQVYTFDCKKDNFDLSILLTEHFEDFSDDKARERVNAIEELLKGTMGEDADLSSKNITLENSLIGKEFFVKSELMLRKYLHIQNKRGVYSIKIISKKTTNQTAKDFEKGFEDVSNKFMDSFQIIEK